MELNSELARPKWEKVVVVGVGLLGGSIGLALRQRRLANQVVGVGRPGKPPLGAVAIGALDSAEENIERAALNADLVICCAPVQQIPDLILRCSRAMLPTGLLTDVGSTKGSIVEEIERTAPGVAFVGSHPLAGGTASGFEHAQHDLLEGSLVIVTPSRETSAANLERIMQLWTSLGARTCMMTPEEHDVALAQTSHLPHIVAAALSAATATNLLPLTATGWRSTTRIAQGNAKLWRQILEENRLPALQALKNFGKVLEHWQRALENADGDALEKLLEDGKATRDALGS